MKTAEDFFGHLIIRECSGVGYLKNVETPSVVMQMPQVKNVQYLGAL